tara:strand:+ start:1196 stop:1936 length:741 start_codon:yes stop_codon:yes gene_type:complete
MTLNEIVYNIKNILEGGVTTEDSNISTRQIESMVHYHRAQLLFKYTDSGRYISRQILSLTRMNIASTPNSGLISETGVVKFGFLPDYLGFPNNRALVSLSVMSLGADNETKLLPIHMKQDKSFMSASRFTYNENSPFATIERFQQQNRLCFWEGDGIPLDDNWNTYALEYIASQPPEINPYPIPDELVAPLIETVLSKEFNMMLAIGKDYFNNSVDDNMQGPAVSTKQRPVTQPSAKARSRRSRAR